jgi:hypothetical protein
MGLECRRYFYKYSLSGGMEMFTHKRMVSSTGVMQINMISINDTVIEWLDADTFHLADLANAIGIDRDHQAKAKVTIEIVKGPCEVCGKNITTGDKLCDKCGKMICTECAKTDLTGTYCSKCRDQKSKRVSE